MGLVRIAPVTPISILQPRAVPKSEADFGQALKSELERQSSIKDYSETERICVKSRIIKVSAHAQKRLDERNVHMNGADQARLSAAMDKVQEKGADKSLILLDNLALVVSARNRVVITAVDSSSAKDSVFTGIDSAVIA